MFEDIDAKSGGIIVTAESDDRSVAYGIWTRNRGGSLPVAEGWDVLHRRYPNEPRFVLLNVYEEVVGTHADESWSPTTFLDKVQRVLDGAGGKLHPELRDLLTLAEDELHPLSDEESARLDRIRVRIGMRGSVSGRGRGDDVAAAKKRMTRLSSDLVREVHDRTSGGKSLASTGTATSAGTDWKSSMAAATEANKTSKPYSATEKVGVGDVLEHPKFGPGVVTSVEADRAQILFESGARKLVVAGKA